MVSKVIFWDFDGTLARREGMFSKTLLQILNEQENGHSYKIEDIRPFLLTGFPWHSPEKSHPELSAPEKWWSFVEDIFVRAYTGIGIEKRRADKYAKLAHMKYIDPSGFLLYEDTEATLSYFINAGWRNVILSNHAPELPRIVAALGLDKYLEHCLSSAHIGYEKPHPEIYRFALQQAGNPQKVWMIGDNIRADVKGAEALGINAILVRKPVAEKVKYYSDTIYGVIDIIEGDRDHYAGAR